MCKKNCCLLSIVFLVIICVLCGYIFMYKGNDCECSSQDKEVKQKENVDSKENDTNKVENKNSNSTDNTCECNNQVEQPTNLNYSYKDIAGYYTFEEDNPNINDKHIATFVYAIYLWENGTFRYEFATNTLSSILGNYTIVGDEIHLNYLFEGGNDAAITATKGEQVLKIKDKNTIIDNNAHFASSGGSKNISLYRNTNESYSEFDVENIINNYILVNNQTR